ncbi:MAG: UDP-glucose 4-epimerase GalE [Mesorhizobium sp.]|nr:UDP-glucose 4-epimerase GalE [Mesorhizobium sp.]
MRILVTGGAGYIGSHICVAALDAGHDVAVFDNFCNSDPETLNQIERITGRPYTIYEGDIRKQTDIDMALRQHGSELVIHLAGLKAVGESVARPLDYFATNVSGTAALLTAMQRQNVAKLVFSSSATVYGEPVELPLRESHPLCPTNPYGRSKLVAEWLCSDFQRANSGFAVAALRYFNPVGAHPSGEIGENPLGHPNNLMPFVTQVASGRRPLLEVFGDDYPTQDGTGVRDYLHVCDLAEGHLAALKLLEKPGFTALNLGTGTGRSVLDVVRTFEAVNSCRVPYAVVPRRHGDVAVYYADPTAALGALGWRARHSLADMCRDAWAWERQRGNVVEHESAVSPAVAAAALDGKFGGSVDSALRRAMRRSAADVATISAR